MLFDFLSCLKPQTRTKQNLSFEEAHRAAEAPGVPMGKHWHHFHLQDTPVTYIFVLPLSFRFGPFGVLVHFLEGFNFIGKQRFFFGNFRFQQIDAVIHGGQVGFKQTLK